MVIHAGWFSEGLVVVPLMEAGAEGMGVPLR